MQQYTTLIFIALLGLAFYFLILRPQRKRQQAIQQTMSALSPGNRVMLASGLFGTVVSVGPKQVVLEISPGTELTVLKQAISRIVTADDEDNMEEHDELDEEDTVTADAAIEEHASRCPSVRSRSRRWQPLPSLPLNRTPHHQLVTRSRRP